VAAAERRADLLPIGRFSKRANLSVHQLRYYHEVRILEPAQVDSESGYRYYSSFQVQTAEIIAILRSLDVPLAQIRALLEHPDEAHVAEVLGAHRRTLEARFGEARQKLKAIDAFLKEGQLQMRLEEPNDLVPVRVDSVRVHQPSGQHVVILVDDAGGRSLPIWIGMFEGNAIALKITQKVTERPMSHDLFASSLSAYGVTPTRVVIWKPESSEQVFLAALHLSRSGKAQIVDCRPSDGIALAVRTGAEVFVSARTMERDGVVTNGAVPETSPPGAFTMAVRDEGGSPLGTLVAHRPVAEGDRIWVSMPFEVTGATAGAPEEFEVTAKPKPEKGKSILYLLPPPEPPADPEPEN
jgi:bifunctional DNase/RNase/DNA-binding transcriptional MerR regulator